MIGHDIDSTLSPTEGSHEIALRLRELSALLPSGRTDCLFCPAKTWFLLHTMPTESPTKSSKEIHVEMHPARGERLSKSSRGGNDKDREKGHNWLPSKR